jgi:NAD(P)-dependent dehydrogenase (short-subunit alcohol dehydrogenase family)
LDVSSDESVQQAAKAVIAHTGGRVNLLINNVSSTQGTDAMYED